MNLLKWLEFDRKNTVEYKEAEQWYTNIANEGESDWLSEGEEGLDMGFLLECAKIEFKDAQESFDELDAKSENMFRFSIGLSGASFVAVKMLTGTGQPEPWVLASCLTFLVPVIITLIARKPATLSVEMSTPYMLDGIRKMNPEYIKKMLAANYRIASVGYRVVGKRKSLYLDLATYSLVISTVLFATSVLLHSFFGS